MNIEISTPWLDNDITRMQEQLDNLVAAKNQVYRRLESLNSMWEGAAQYIFINQTRIDETVLQGLVNNLNNLIECMQYAKSEYERCNDEVNSKIAGIRLANDT
jgi:uncharacterized protein YukE